MRPGHVKDDHSDCYSIERSAEVHDDRLSLDGASGMREFIWTYPP